MILNGKPDKHRVRPTEEVYILRVKTVKSLTGSTPVVD